MSIEPIWNKETLEKRRPVWDAISWLYLDTDINTEIDLIVDRLSKSNYSIAELTQIYETEVAPAVWWNLSLIPGEWAGFPMDWLEAKIQKHYRFTVWLYSIPVLGLMSKLWMTLLTRYFWGKVTRKLEALEKLSPIVPLSELERKVMTLLAKLPVECLQARADKPVSVEAILGLKAQWAQANVRDRKWTGSGFFTYFKLPKGRQLPKIDPPDFILNLATAEIKGLQAHVEFILWVEEGRLSYLEGFGYEDWPEEQPVVSIEPSLKVTCTCCGYKTLSIQPAQLPKRYGICPVCAWEDNELQLKDPDLTEGVNLASLRQAQSNYRLSGAAHESVAFQTRTPHPDELKDSQWIPLSETKQFEILPGLPPYGPEPEQFPSSDLSSPPEGLVVRFYPEDEASWVGNFQGLGYSYSGVLVHPDTVHLIVIASGEGYVIHPKTKKLVENIGGIIQEVFYYPEQSLFLMKDMADLIGIDSTGKRFETCVGLDGVRVLAMEWPILYGESWDCSDLWYPFKLNLETGQLLAE